LIFVQNFRYLKRKKRTAKIKLA